MVVTTRSDTGYNKGMNIGTLTFTPVQDSLHLVAQPVKQLLQATALPGVLVAKIDPSLSDTAAFCQEFTIGMEQGANCVIIEAKRGDRVWYAACVILAVNRIDVNGAVRKLLDARKTSFAPMDKAVQMTGMEYGGITPLGLPGDWPILVDEKVVGVEAVIVGSGIRGSKLVVPGQLLATLPGAQVAAIAKGA